MRFPSVTSPLLRRPLLPAIGCFAMAIFLAMFLDGCIFGGTGTDTDNGLTDTKANKSALSARIVDSSGHPVPGITVAVYDIGFRPDAGKAQASLVADSAKIHISDTAGLVDIALINAGVYVLEGSRGGETVLFDTLRIGNPKAAAVIDFAVRKVRPYKGRVKLASGMHVDSGTVFIQGTRRWARVDASGAYDLGTLPVDAGRMAVGMRYAARPGSVQQISATVIKADTTGPVSIPRDTVKYTCKDIPKDSALKQLSPAFTGRADSTVGDTGKPVVAPASLDTGRVNAALKSCDSLPTGSVVNVKIPDTSKSAVGAKDSVSVPYIVVTQKVLNTQFEEYSTQVVSYSECVEAPGTERTTFAVEFQLTDLGSDLVVGDLAGKCVKP